MCQEKPWTTTHKERGKEQEQLETEQELQEMERLGYSWEGTKTLAKNRARRRVLVDALSSSGAIRNDDDDDDDVSGDYRVS